MADDTGSFYAPALLTGTSSEFMGTKPLPRLLRQRRVVFVLGPEGVGKSTVAGTLAGPDHVRFDTRELDRLLLDRVRTGHWDGPILANASIVLDGPVWMRNRTGAVQLLAELARSRATAGFRTLFCQVVADGSVEELINAMEAGSSVVVGLRFPAGRRARLRCARRLCDDLHLPREVAVGSEGLEPWRYDRLVAWLVERTWREP